MGIENTTLQAINNLVETCKDGERGYKTAADNIDNPQLKSELNRFAQQRAGFRNELESCAKQFGSSQLGSSTLGSTMQQPSGFTSTVSTPSSTSMPSGTTSAGSTVNRGWVNLNSAISGHDNKAILSECENGDAATLRTYETVMNSSDIPSNVKSVLQKQHDEIEAAKNVVSSLKSNVI